MSGTLTAVAVFGAGIATLATPCILPLIPIYLALLVGESASAARDPRLRWRLLRSTALFVAGFALVFALLGSGASALGSLLAAHRTGLTIGGGALIALLGLLSLGLVKLPWLDRDFKLAGPHRVNGVLGSFLFGAVFGLGWTPCAGPVLAGVLSLAALETSRLAGAGLLLIYSAGIGLPLLLIAAFADRALPLLRRLQPRLVALQRVTGAVMIAAGLFFVVDGVRTAAPDRAPLAALTTDGQELAPLIGAPLERPRLLHLVDENCPVCKRMAASMAALGNDCSEANVDVKAVDLSDPRNRGLRQELAVTAVPTLLLLDDSGQLRHRLIGERSLDELRGLAASLQATSCAGVAPIDPALLPDSASCGGATEGTGMTSGLGVCG